MPTVERHKIDVMQAQSVIASLCTAIELTKQICQIDHKKFDLDTKISWALPTDANETKLALKLATTKDGCHSRQASQLGIPASLKLFD